jgi:hypothetical protein
MLPLCCGVRSAGNAAGPRTPAAVPRHRRGLGSERPPHGAPHLSIGARQLSRVLSGAPTLSRLQ